MLEELLRMGIKVAVASMVVGATLNHFGFNTEFLLNKAGMTPERVQELLQQGMAWALPNMMLGSLVIIPAWLLIILFRPPRSSE
ncbi:MAG TPA: hypothetical protein VM867_07620 [Xanthobacteraceae bacterium]|nr:hypothetical protein [Xanthobacteraceae bacterium]